MIILPNKLAPFVDKALRIIRPWDSYLQQFTQAPPNIASATVGVSPFGFVAREPGTVAITGGTVTGITLTRGATTIVLNATTQLIPVSINDTVSIAYSVLPTVQFLPSYGQNTTAA